MSLKKCLEFLKKLVDLVLPIVTIIAIIISGIWTYNLFIIKRENYPHANIEQRLSHIALSDSINLLRLEIQLSNTGNSKLVLKKSIIRIQQILPVLPCAEPEPCAVNQVNTALKEIIRKEDRFSWPLLSERNKIFPESFDIEPGEKDVIDFEFVIPLKVEAVRVYSYFQNEKKINGANEVGWSISTYYDLREPCRGTAK